MAQLTLEAIRKQHEELLSKSVEMSDEDYSQVNAFLETLARAGVYIEEPDERSLLRALIRYWISVLIDQKNVSPIIHLQPFDPSQVGDRTKKTSSNKQQYMGPFLAPPRPPYELVGRDELLRDLKKRLFTQDRLASVALSGLPGVGKSALAVALAYDREVTEYFSDGVLWANLGRKPNVLAHLGVWGTALGIPQAEMALLNTIEARAQAIHVTIGTRKILLVIDDAWETESALAFKLGGPNCAYLVTTRLSEVAKRFTGGGVTVTQELKENDGLRLLSRLAPEAVKAAPNETRSLVRAVGGLPLALILVGNYLRVQAGGGELRRLHSALDQLRRAEERLRLEQPQAVLERQSSLPADVPLSLMAAIGISEEILDKASQYTLQTLSVFPPKPNTFSEEAALSVSASSTKALDILVDSGLLENSRPSRYTLHQTIADYARTKLVDMAAFERMVDFFMRYVETYKTDYAALDLEIRNVLAALQIAFGQGMQADLVKGTNDLFHFLETRGLYVQAEAHLKQAKEAAKELGDTVGLLTVLLNLGKVNLRRGDYTQAEAYLQEGLALVSKIGYLELKSALLSTLGEVLVASGDYEQAETSSQEGLNLARQAGNAELISALLGNLGLVAINRGEYERAKAYWQEGLAITLQINNIERTSVLLGNLGWVAINHGDYEQAEKYFQQGLELVRQIGNRQRIGALLGNLGLVAINRGEYEQAEEYWREGLNIARQIGQPDQIITLLQNLGVVTALQQNFEQARTYVQEGVDLARQIADREKLVNILSLLGELYLEMQLLDSASLAFSEVLEIAREVNQEAVATAQYGLARVAIAQGNKAEALYQGQASLENFEKIHSSKAVDVREWLATLLA
jgi:tetratricopeptide (TPR) repeat protein